MLKKHLCSYKIKCCCCHGTGSAESHEITTTPSRRAVHISAQHKASLNEQNVQSSVEELNNIWLKMCEMFLGAWSLQESQRIRSRIMIQQKSVLVVIKLYCRSLEIINENCCVTTFADLIVSTKCACGRRDFKWGLLAYTQTGEERGEGGKNNPKLSLLRIQRCRVDPFSFFFYTELDITSSLSDSNDTLLRA